MPPSAPASTVIALTALVCAGGAMWLSSPDEGVLYEISR